MLSKQNQIIFLTNTSDLSAKAEQLAQNVAFRIPNSNIDQNGNKITPKTQAFNSNVQQSALAVNQQNNKWKVPGTKLPNTPQEVARQM